MKLLSIIIPTYNVEKYIDECLSSLTTLEKFKDVEVIIINDGSTDSSEKIANMYVQRFPSLFKLVSKENGGYGSVLNCGIQNASGKYIKVLDSDDWFDVSSLDRYIDVMRNAKSDIVATEFTMINMSTNQKKKFDIPYKLLGKNNFAFKEVCNELFVAMHMFTVKRDLYVQNDILIDENTFYTDLEFVIFPIKYCETIEYHDINLYQYRVGIPGQSVSHEGWFKHRYDHQKVCCALLCCLSDYKKDDPRYMYIKNKVYELITVHFRMYTQFPPEKKRLRNDLIEFENKIKSVKSDWRNQSKDIWVNILVDSRYYLMKFEQIGYYLKKKMKKG